MLCKYCEVDKPESEFETCGVKKGVRYFRKKCKKCKQGTQKVRRDNNRDWFEEFKRSLECVRCGEDDFRCFVFHHPDPSKKEANVCDLMTYSKKRIQQELAVCECLCSNCHLIHHYDERVEQAAARKADKLNQSTKK